MLGDDLEEVNLASSSFAEKIIEFSGDYADKWYLPGEKISFENVKHVSGIEVVEVENKELFTPEEQANREAAQENDDEEENNSEDDYDEYSMTKLKITMKLLNIAEDDVKEKLESWVSANDMTEITYLNHELVEKTDDFFLINVYYRVDLYYVSSYFGDSIESPFTEIWDEYMNFIIDEGVCFTNKKVDVTLRDSLRKNIDYLAKNIAIDYHPNSKDVVRDLVHPALYSFIKGVSKFKPGRKYYAKSKNVEKKDYWGRDYEESNYQWLPTPFDISDDGKCTIMEYINNLDRSKFPHLYTDLENLFNDFLPYLEQVWSFVKSTRFYQGKDNAYDETEVESKDKVDVSLRGRELQVIVKIVEYTLQPGQSYEGVWHAEGMSHEHIVMSGIYFLDRDNNMSGGDLRFKRAFTIAERNKVLYGVPQMRPTTINQVAYEGFVPLGKFPTSEGYLLVFPNCHIHKISKLINNSNSTISRRIVVFFIVDPDETIISTRDIAPQQDEIDLHRAKAYRLELMAERKFNKDKLNVRDIELCEH